jgi:hypothetical protein
MCRLLADPTAARELGLRAAAAANRFDVHAIADRVWARYQTLI